MTAQEWKEKGRASAEVVPLTLPSGMVIEARRPGPMQFAFWDRLPMLFGPAAAGNGTPEEAVEVAGFMRELLVFCCMAPRISMTPAEDEIHPRDLPEKDWLFIVRWAMRLEEAAAVRPFRSQREDDGGGDDGEAVFGETVGADGDTGPGAGAGVRPGGGGASIRVVRERRKEYRTD